MVQKIVTGESRVEIATNSWANASYFVQIKGSFGREVKRWVKIDK
jgi:hypothetical protein